MKQNKSRNRFPNGNRYTPSRLKPPSLLDAFREEKSELTGPSLQLSSGHTLDVDGCTAVLACDGDLVRLEVTGAILTVLGDGLETSDFSAHTLTIRGGIRSIELEPARRKRKEGAR